MTEDEYCNATALATIRTMKDMAHGLNIFEGENEARRVAILAVLREIEADLVAEIDIEAAAENCAESAAETFSVPAGVYEITVRGTGGSVRCTVPYDGDYFANGVRHTGLKAGDVIEIGPPNESS